MPKETDTQDRPRLIIEGVTQQGETFRPSDWAERVSGNIAAYDRSGRFRYSPLLTPGVRGGLKCVMVDPALRESDPAAFADLMEFVRTNRLRICDESVDALHTHGVRLYDYGVRPPEKYEDNSG